MKDGEVTLPLISYEKPALSRDYITKVLSRIKEFGFVIIQYAPPSGEVFHLQNWLSLIYEDYEGVCRIYWILAIICLRYLVGIYCDWRWGGKKRSAPFLSSLFDVEALPILLIQEISFHLTLTDAIWIHLLGTSSFLFLYSSKRIQAFHVINHEGEGGRTLLTDSFKIAEIVKGQFFVGLFTLTW